MVKNRLYWAVCITLIGVGCFHPGKHVRVTPLDDGGRSLKLQPIPAGWVKNKTLAAPWGTGLSEFIRLLPDSNYTLTYWEERRGTKSTGPAIIPHATLKYSRNTSISVEEVRLEFIITRFVNQMVREQPEDYQLVGIKRSIVLLKTGYPQLVAADVIRHKLLMVYGSPVEFEGNSFRYYDDDTEMKIMELDDRHITIHSISLKHSADLARTLEKTFSRESLEEQKKRLIEQLDF